MPVPSKQTTNHGCPGDAREIGARSSDTRHESHVRDEEVTLLISIEIIAFQSRNKEKNDEK